jgi:hypothetical protein
MNYSRRKFIGVTGVVIGVPISGCSEDTDGDVVTPTDGQDDGDAPSSDGVNVGETLLYQQDGKKLAFTIKSAELRDHLIYTQSNYIYSEVPETQDHTFLLLRTKVENTGESPVSTPDGLTLVIDGSQYETAGAYSFEPRYDGYNELLPGASTEGWIIFPVPPVDSQARFSVDFSSFGESNTGTWLISLSELERIQYDYSGNELGEKISFGTDQTMYDIGAIEVNETQSYESESGDYIIDSGDGKKYVLVNCEAKNTGENTVSVPDRFSMSLLTDSKQFDAGGYRGSDAYEGGEISSGIQRSGIVQFEVPQSTSSYTLQVNLTDNINATWNL